MEIRRIKIILYVIVLFLIPSFSNIYGATLSKPANNLGLVAYWSFNEGTSTVATDFSGRGNIGTLNSFSAPASATSGWGSGKFGPGLNFGGTSDYVSIDGVANDVTETSFAFSVWIKSTWTAGFDTVLAINTAALGNQTQLFIDNTLTIRVYDGTQDATELSSSGSVVDGKWHHVVYSRSGATGTLYVDGVSQGTHTANDTFTGTDLWSLGQEFDAGPVASDLYAGGMDDVRIYSRPLSGTEVLNLYNSGSIRINSSQGNLITNGLVGYWSLNSSDVSDRVYDKSGNNNNGYVSGRATSTLKTIGKLGQSFDLDGTADYVYLGTPASLFPTSAITMSAWIKPDQLAVASQVLSNDDGLTISNQMRTQGNGLRCSIANTTSTQGSTLVAGEWAHVACVYDGANIINYINGLNVGSTPLTGNITYPNSNTEPWRIGRRGDAAPGYFDGKIDEVRVYNRALSASEMKTLYNSGESRINSSQNVINGSSLNSGLVGLWSFNSPDITTVVSDRSGNGHNGYFSGGATSTAKTIGKVGQAIRFDGVNDTVLIAHSNALDLDMSESATFSFWINKTSASATAGPIYKRTSGSPGYSIDIPTTGAVSFSIGDLFSNNNRVSNDTSTTMNLNEWYHVVVTYDGSITSSGIKIYFNGVLQPMTNAFDNYGGGSSSNGFDFSLGARESGTSRLLDGKMDEVRMYNRVLTDSEIKQLYLLGR